MSDKTTPSHTPGPWRWELNEKSKGLHLVGGGQREYDLTIIEPVRWGMGRASLMIRDTAHDGMNIMHKLHERRDWIAPFPGRSHHADWCAAVTHPDMRLIEAVPDLLEVAEAIEFALSQGMPAAMVLDENSPIRDCLRAALAKATEQS